MPFKKGALLILVATVVEFVVAGPVVFNSSEWHGGNGQFATFELNVGTPSQAIRVLPEPFKTALVVIGEEGCLPDSLIQNCSQNRGNVFDRHESQTWSQVSVTNWDQSEAILKPPRLNGNGTVREEPFLQHPVSSRTLNNYGNDVVKGKSMGKDWAIQDQGIMSVGTQYPFVGMLGLGTNMDGMAKNPTSLFDNVRGISGMKSVSWSYHAGNKAKKTPGSLVFGGYDATRGERSSLMQAFQTQPHHNFEVMMNSITVSSQEKSNASTSRSIILGMTPVSLDFSRPDLEFPTGVCGEIAEEFGLRWDDAVKRYTVTTSRHNELLAGNASLKFILAATPGPQRSYTVSYQSLVFNATSPAVNESTRYIAIRGNNNERYNLGRAFFQDTVITTHFDRKPWPTIYLLQAKYNPKVSPDIREIDTQLFLRAHSVSDADDRLSIILPVVLVSIALILIVAYMIYARRIGWIPFNYLRKKEAGDQTETFPAAGLTGDRKEGSGSSEQTESNAGLASHAAEVDPLDGCPNPPPRYSIALAEAQLEKEAKLRETAANGS